MCFILRAAAGWISSFRLPATPSRSLESHDGSTPTCWRVNVGLSTPEDIVLAKLWWRLESRSEIQWRDCVEIAATQELDREYLLHWADVLGVVEDLEDLLAE